MSQSKRWQGKYRFVRGENRLQRKGNRVSVFLRIQWVLAYLRRKAGSRHELSLTHRGTRLGVDFNLFALLNRGLAGKSSGLEGWKAGTGIRFDRWGAVNDAKWTVSFISFICTQDELGRESCGKICHITGAKEIGVAGKTCRYLVNWHRGRSCCCWDSLKLPVRKHLISSWGIS